MYENISTKTPIIHLLMIFDNELLHVNTEICQHVSHKPQCTF